MRTYEETYERILSKKAIAEKEIKARNKKLIVSVTTVSCLCICIVAMFAMSKARISINLNDKEGSNTYNHFDTKSDSVEDDVNGISTTLAENSSTQIPEKSNEEDTALSNGNNNGTDTTDLPVDEDSTTTLLSPQVITTNNHGGGELPDWKKEEIEKHRIRMVRTAMRAVAEDDVDKINIDKSYIISLYGKPGLEEQGKEYYLMHLEGDVFYYEVEIDAAGIKVYGYEKFIK